MSDWLVASPDPWSPEVREVISRRAPPGFEMRFGMAADPGWAELLARCDFLLVGMTPVDAALLARAPRLRLVQRWGIGVDAVDLAAAEAAGVPVAITAGANADAVAEHTVMMMLAALRRLALVDRALREGRWLFREMRAQCLMLRGREVGLIGFGHVGRAVAARLGAFGVRVAYTDPVRPSAAEERAYGVRFLPFETLLAECDIISLHCPGGGSNRHLLDGRALDRMRPGAILVNCARGDLVEEAALVSALAAGRIAAASLDVFETEPLPAGNPLLALDNVCLSPHTAASVFDNVANVADHAFGNMLRVLRGEALAPKDAVVIPSRPRFPAPPG
jgi:phosphoglycerate dehydrogenase-like enzyme